MYATQNIRKPFVTSAERAVFFRTLAQSPIWNEDRPPIYAPVVKGVLLGAEALYCILGRFSQERPGAFVRERKELLQNGDEIVLDTLEEALTC